MTDRIPICERMGLESAQKILTDIGLVSQQVVSAMVRYDGRKTVENVHLDKIVASSSAILATLGKAVVLKERVIDDRLVDWLNSEEPQICLETLNQMNMLLNADLDDGVKNFFQTSRARAIASMNDKSNEAIRLFQKHKDCFHFLLTTDVWNHERDAQRQAWVVPERNMPPATEQQMETSEEQAIDLKLNSILEWLNGWDCRDTHGRTTLLRQPDTCTWLPNTKAYQAWRNTENSFLWLNGKAGAGKSVLAASVIDTLEDALLDGEVLVFFYCDFRDERCASASEVMRSLLCQLLQQLDHHSTDPGDVIDELIRQKDEGTLTISNVTRLARHIFHAASQLPEHPFIVIDALDECKDIEELLTALTELSKGDVRLFVTSRPLQVIKENFSGLPTISMDEMKYEVSTDIKLHVTRELDSHRRLRSVDTNLKEQVNAALCKKAEGMFRWVQCQLSVLKQSTTTVCIRETLNDLPSDINTTYERILLRINKSEEEVVRRALQWLVAALKPLQLCQLMEGLSIDLRRRVLDYESIPVHGSAVLDSLGSLVTYDELTDVVVLAHFSVKGYLVGEFTRTKHPAYHINEQAAHTQLALLCMSYITAYIKCNQQSGRDGRLTRNAFTVATRRDASDAVSFLAAKHARYPPPLSGSHPLLDYVQSRGFHHLDRVYVGSREILDAIETLHMDAQQYPSDWDRLCERSYSFYGSNPWPTLEHDFVLYILIAFAPDPLLRLYIGLSKPLKPKDGTNPLVYAAQCCKVEHARTLLSSGVSLNRRGWRVSSRPHQGLPLESAVTTPALVDLFLTKGSSVPHALFMRVFKRWGYLACVVAKLLQTDEFMEWAADVRDEGLLLRVLEPTHLSHSYSYGPPYHDPNQDIDAIRRRLMQIGCDPSAGFNEGSLRRAAFSGHVSTVKQMLAFNTPIPPDIILDASRSRNSNATMIRFFLDRGCDADTLSPSGANALHFVMDLEPRLPEDDCLESVNVLVDAGCNPSARDLVDETPLHLAASLGYISVIKYLLSQHAPLPPDILLLPQTSSDMPLTTPHLLAVSTIRFLMHEGASVHVLSANGSTPLHLLLANPTIVSDTERMEAAKILIDAGCDPCQPNAVGETPFDVAAINGHLFVVEYLFSLNLSPSPSILLSVSSSVFSEANSMIKFLINRGVSVHATRPNGDTVLHLSMNVFSEEDCLQRIKIFVNAGCDTCVRNMAGKTPFYNAAKQRYISIMEYLISVGTPIPSDAMVAIFEQDDQSDPPRGPYPTIRFLQENGGDIHVTRNGDNLLHLAAMLDSEHDALRITRLLVHAGCSPRILNSADESPLHIAAQNGHVSVVDHCLSLDLPLPPDILLAASRGYSKKAKMIRFLINKGANVCVISANGDTPLHLILATGEEDDRLESAKILIEAGCDPRAKNLAGKMAIHVAATSGFISVLEYLLSQDIPLPHNNFLLKKGIDVQSATINYGDAAGLMRHMPSFIPEEERFLARAKFLLSLGWDFSSKDTTGETGFHVIARQGDIATLKYLVSQHIPLPADVLLAAVPSDKNLCMSHTVLVVCFLVYEGASVSVTAPNGDTPLHLVVRSKLADPREYLHYGLSDRCDLCKVIEILLDHGSDPYARNAEGQTPLDLAEAKGHFFKENFLRLVHNSEARVAQTSYS